VDATLSPGINALASLVYGFDLERIAVEKAVPAIAPRPIFFIHGEQDNTIPVAHARRLKAASRGPNDRLWILPGRRHTECIRLEGIQRPVSPIRSECIATVTAFFEHWLR
jgi:fermentation-respiration switch protein FrsA (DUF1100 family)